ncbi:MAG: LysR family transcriptional regulator [Pleurocapsa sp. MO_192.B19]|nr:LysR family transcriptional regulator [Pleurocapsa sp. MO_192.B19]
MREISRRQLINVVGKNPTQLGISQSGVSHAIGFATSLREIATWETELDVTLIERIRAGLVLTE